MVPETIALAWRGREGSRKTGAEDYEKNKTQYVIQRAAPCLSVASTMAMLLAAVCLVGSSFLPPFLDLHPVHYGPFSWVQASP